MRDEVASAAPTHATLIGTLARPETFAFSFSVDGVVDSAVSAAGASSPPAPPDADDGSVLTASFPARAGAPRASRVAGHAWLSRVTDVDADAVSGCAGADVVRGEYEGGAKVWEATADLLALLPALRLRDARVLDLGCGAGLAGVGALGEGAAHVVFSDLNDAVLERVTAPTVAANAAAAAAAAGRAAGSALLLAGPWAALLAAARGDGARVRDAAAGGDGAATAARAALARRFDVILSAETAYRPAACATLAALAAALLTPRGAAFFATKRFYFGAELGGGTDALLAALRNEPGLAAAVIREATDCGVARDIVRVSRSGAGEPEGAASG